jgi:hypothetical protein
MPPSPNARARRAQSRLGLGVLLVCLACLLPPPVAAQSPVTAVANRVWSQFDLVIYGLNVAWPTDPLQKLIEVKGPQVCFAPLAQECFTPEVCQGTGPYESTRVYYPPPVIYVRVGIGEQRIYAGYSPLC